MGWGKTIYWLPQCSAAVFLCQGLHVVTVGEAYHYCYPELDADDERYM